MARRKKSSPLEDLVDLASLLPWKAGIGLAIGFFLLFHWLAQPTNDAPPGTVAQLGVFAKLLQMLATIGQFVIPMAFLAGAGISAWRERRSTREDGASGTRTRPRAPDRAPSSGSTPRREPAAPFAQGDGSTDRVASAYSSPVGVPTTTDVPSQLATGLDVERMLDAIEWRRFEEATARCFQLKGFSASVQPHGGDRGVDVKLSLEATPEVLAGVVQCKHWGSKQIGVELLRALRGSMADFGASQGYFVTSSTFTQHAADFAAANQIEAVDRQELVRMILGFTPEQRDSVLRVATEGRYDVPTCPSCGTKMVKRQRRDGGHEFWGCLSFPRCRVVFNLDKT